MSGGKTATLANGTYCFHNVTLSGGATPDRGRSGADQSHGPAQRQRRQLPEPHVRARESADREQLRRCGTASCSRAAPAPTWPSTRRGRASRSPAAPGVRRAAGQDVHRSGNGAVHYDVQLLDRLGELRALGNKPEAATGLALLASREYCIAGVHTGGARRGQDEARASTPTTGSDCRAGARRNHRVSTACAAVMIVTTIPKSATCRWEWR